ncbi:MAG: hypothetical protein IBX43_07605 [Campylobacterales bacterium]|nr:hypothetical protein [Campylobacterales bacterium]
MCLVLGVLLGALSVNFFLNGFYLSSLVTAVMALALFALMVRNVNCVKNGCKTRLKKEDKNDN